VISFSIRVRILQHIDYLKKHVDITDEADSKTFNHVYENFTNTSKKLAIAQGIQIFIAALLYVSIITSLARGVSPFIAEVISPLVALSSVVGTAVLTVIFAGLSYFTRMVLNDLLAEHSHLVALLVKHNTSFVAHPHYKYGFVKNYEIEENSSDD
jgi:hypothetical protein